MGRWKLLVRDEPPYSPRCRKRSAFPNPSAARRSAICRTVNPSGKVTHRAQTSPFAILAITSSGVIEGLNRYAPGFKPLLLPVARTIRVNPSELRMTLCAARMRPMSPADDPLGIGTINVPEPPRGSSVLRTDHHKARTIRARPVHE